MKKLFALALCLVAVLGPLWLAAQPVVQNTISGNEVWVASQTPGGQGQWIGIDTVRDGERLILQSGAGAATATATGGVLYWVGTAPTTWAITLPSPAFGGELVTLATDTTLTTMVTVTAGSGDTLHATYNSQTLTALAPVIFIYKASSKIWYRIQ